MYATLTATDPTDPTDGAAAPVAAHLLTDAGGAPPLAFRLWDDDATWLGSGAAWAVADHLLGRAADEVADAVQLLWFDGPRTAEGVAAEERAGRERIWPAVSDAPGLTEVYVLRRDGGASVVLQFVTAAEHLEEIQRRVLSSDLLPGEDVALLPGPDRVEVRRVVTPAADPVTWRVDPAASTARFRVRNLGVRRVTGTVPVVAGEAEVDASGAVTRLTGEVEAAGIDTGNARRDTDLRSPKLLDAAQHPRWRFEATRVVGTDGSMRAEGTLHARSACPVEWVARSEDGDGGVRRVRATASIDRSVAGVRAPRLLIGRTVDVELDLVFRPPG